MAIDLFTLALKIQTTGAAEAQAALRGVEGAGKQAASGLGATTRSTTEASSALRRVRSDIALASADFRAGRISSVDFGTAMTMARQEALRLGSGMTAMSAVSTHVAGAFRNLATKGVGLLRSELGTLITVVGVAAFFRESFREADQLNNSLVRLAGTAKLTGVPLAFLQQVSANAQHDFKLSALQANDLATQMARLAGKAGDVGQTAPLLAAFLNIGAARGLTAQQTLDAVRQAILGIDEGTDKLFNKNPSTLYKEFGAAIGVSVGNMTDQQKAMALAAAAMADFTKVGNAYGTWLETTAGKQAVFQARLDSMQAGFGNAMAPARETALVVGTVLVQAFNVAINVLKTFGLVLAVTVTGAIAAVEFAVGGLVLALGTLLDAPAALLRKFGVDVEFGVADRMIATGNRIIAHSGAVARATKDEWNKQMGAIWGGRPEAPSAGLLTGSAGGRSGGGGGGGGGGATAAAGLDINDDPRTGVMQSGGGLAIRTSEAFKTLPAATANAAGLAAAEMRAGIVRNFQQGIGDALAEGIGGGIQAFLRTGNIGAGFAALGKGLLRGIGSAMVQFGKASLAASTLMKAIQSGLASFLPGGAIVASLAMIALGSALGGIGGAAESSFGQMSPDGGLGGGRREAQVTRIVLSDTRAGGATAPETKPMLNVTMIGTDDRRAQRELVKLLNNGLANGESLNLPRRG